MLPSTRVAGGLAGTASRLEDDCLGTTLLLFGADVRRRPRRGADHRRGHEAPRRRLLQCPLAESRGAGRAAISGQCAALSHYA